MKRISTRTRIIVVAASIAAVAFAATAIGAQPRKGNYSYGYRTTSSPIITTVSFKVVGRPGHRKVKDFAYSSSGCFDPWEVSGLIRVKRSGKFHFKGQGHSSFSNPKVEVTGKFVSKRKAKGTATSEDGTGCSTKFVAKKGGFVEVAPAP